MASQSQSLWRGPSIDVSVQTRTESLHRACGGQLLKPDKCHIFWHSSRRLSSSSANSISGRPTFLSCQCRNALQEDHRSDDLSPRSRWSLEHMGVFDTRALPWLPPSLSKSLQLSELLHLCHCPTARRDVGSYFRCWRKDCHELYCFGGSPGNGATGEWQSFRIWGPGRERKVDSLKGRRPWLVTTADGAAS